MARLTGRRTRRAVVLKVWFPYSSLSITLDLVRNADSGTPGRPADGVTAAWVLGPGSFSFTNCGPEQIRSLRHVIIC